MAAEEAPEGGKVVQELEPVDVIRLHQLLVTRRAAQEDGEDLRSKDVATICSSSHAMWLCKHVRSVQHSSATLHSKHNVTT